MPLPPLLVRFLRFALIACGALAVMYAVVNIMAATQIEPSDEASIGISRNSMIAYFVVQLVAGVVMLVFGFRKRK